MCYYVKTMCHYVSIIFNNQNATTIDSHHLLSFYNQFSGTKRPDAAIES
jgi:hypothetical protein